MSRHARLRKTFSRLPKPTRSFSEQVRASHRKQNFYPNSLILSKQQLRLRRLVNTYKKPQPRPTYQQIRNHINAKHRDKKWYLINPYDHKKRWDGKISLHEKCHKSLQMYTDAKERYKNQFHQLKKKILQKQDLTLLFEPKSP